MRLVLFIWFLLLIAICQDQDKKLFQVKKFTTDKDSIIIDRVTQINNVGHALVIILKKFELISKVDNEFGYLNIYVNIKDNQTKQCKFSSTNNLCVVETPQQQMDLKVKCQMNCSGEYQLMEAVIVQTDVNGGVYYLAQKQFSVIKLPNSKGPISIQLQSLDEGPQSINKQFQIYSTHKYYPIYLEKSIYLGFQQSGGYLFFVIPQKYREYIVINVGQTHNMISTDQYSHTYLPLNYQKSYKLNTKLFSNDIVFRINYYSYLESNHSVKQNTALTTSQLALPGPRLTLVVLGSHQNSKDVPVATISFPLINRQQMFTYIIPKMKEWAQVQIRFKCKEFSLFLGFQYEDSSIHSVSSDELIYFTMIKNQEIVFETEAIETNQIIQKTIILSNQKALKSSFNRCNLKQKCKFKVNSIDDCTFCNFELKYNSNGSTIFTPIHDDFLQDTIGINEVKHYKYTLLPMQSIEIIINSPKVILYGKMNLVCTIPSQQCRDYVGTIHNPIISENNEKVEKQLLISVHSLDFARFRLRIKKLGDKYIKLKQGEAFSYKLVQNSNQVIFTYPNNHQDISINLIAPLNSLMLIVLLDQNQSTMRRSFDGYVYITQKELRDSNITIKVIKINIHQQQKIHFSIIVSQKQTKYRLVESVTHYDAINPKSQKSYLIDVNHDKKYNLNFYAFNQHQKQINVGIQVNKINYKEIQQHFDKSSFKISKPVETIKLNKYTDQSCDETNCEYLIKFENLMEISLDIGLTLISQDPIIELYDGIWNAFPVQSNQQVFHMYFIPTHANQAVDIIFQTTSPSIKIKSQVWDHGKEKININDWPFPTVKNSPNEGKYAQVDLSFWPSNGNSVTKEVAHFKPKRHFHLEEVKKCFPDCTVLITVKIEQYNKITDKQGNVGGQFKIIVSNNFLQIPQKQSIEFYLDKQSSKLLFIDLKYILHKKVITFFNHYTIGRAKIYGRLYFESDPLPPSQDQHDFSLKQLQTQLSLEWVRNKLNQRKWTSFQSVYICFIFISTELTILNFEYTSQEHVFRTIGLDTYKTIKLFKKSNDTINNLGRQKVLQIMPVRDYKIKMVKTIGNPFYKVIRCQKKNYDSCLESSKVKTKIKNQSQIEDGHQQKNNNLPEPLISKNYQDIRSQCEQCIDFIWLYSNQNSAVDVYVQSINLQLQLQQGKVIHDKIGSQQISRYLINTVHVIQVQIIIMISSGNLKVKVTDYLGIKKQGTSADKKNIFININLDDGTKDKDQLNAKQEQRLNSMKDLHLTIQGKSQQPCSYSLYYRTSSKMYLETGEPIDSQLINNVPKAFFYRNQKNGKRVYLSISVPDTKIFQQLKIHATYFQQTESGVKSVQYTPEIPKFRKNFLKSFTFILPSSYQQIQIIVQSKETTRITLMVYYQQMLNIPYNYQFPIRLNQQQSITLFVQNTQNGVYDITIRKCDQSVPQFSYALGIDNFQQERYALSQLITENWKFYAVPTLQGKSGTLFMKFQIKQQFATFTIKVTYRSARQTALLTKAENHGIINYDVSLSSLAQLIIPRVICQANCANDIKYYLFASQKPTLFKHDFYCSHNFLEGQDSVKGDFIEGTEIKLNNEEKQKKYFKYSYLMPSSIVYLGVKAVVKSTGEQIYYQPIKLHTILGQIYQISLRKIIVLITVGAICFFLFVWGITAFARRGYQRIDDISNVSSAEIINDG